MRDRFSKKGPDLHKKPGAAVEIPVEVLGAEGPPSGASFPGWLPPKNAVGPDGMVGKSDAFKAMMSLALAVAADSLGAALPPAWLVIDAVMTLAFLFIWGLRWEILVVLLPELVPGMSVFPSWTLLALHLGKKGTTSR
jgi:hypothetical protein